MAKADETLARALAIEISKDADYEDVYQAAINYWTDNLKQFDVSSLREAYSEKYDYIFENSH